MCMEFESATASVLGFPERYTLRQGLVGYIVFDILNSSVGLKSLNKILTISLIVWRLTPFSTLFQLYRGCRYTYAFLDILLPLHHTIFLSSHWLLSHLTIVKTMVTGEKGMNADTSPQQEIGQSWNRTSNFLFKSNARYRLR